MRFLLLPLRFLLLLFHTYISRETGLALLAKKMGIKVCILVHPSSYFLLLDFLSFYERPFFLLLILPSCFLALKDTRLVGIAPKG